LALLEES